MLKRFFLVVFLALSVCSTAHALGDREKGALIGAGSVLLYQHITAPRYEPPTGYDRPRVQYLHKYPSRHVPEYRGMYMDCVHPTQMFPIKDNYGNIVGWRQC